MQKTILHLSLTLRGPLLTQSASPGDLGFDVVVARNHNDKSYLPGTLISGKIRQSLEELDDAIKDQDKPDWFAPKLNDWLGYRAENDFPLRKQLYFSDFILDQETPTASTRYRIKIDPERGAVEQHQIVMLENPFISGESYTFNGQIHFFSPSADVDSIKQHIDIAIKWFSHLGALKSIGYGQVEKVDISNVESQIIAEPKAAKTPDKLGFVLQPLYPFCLAGKPNADNLFKSELIISGGAIKGCIATTWTQLLEQNSINFTTLQAHFSQLHISHAFAGVDENKRPVVAPLSIVTTIEIIKHPEKEVEKKTHYYDVAQLPSACLIDGQAPQFSVDWKDSEKTLTSYPWPYIRFKNWGWDSPKAELRVHTAIDRKTIRSKENELFAYEQIVPEQKQWVGEIDLTGIDENQRAKVLEELKALCQYGIAGLGKTKTPVQIQLIDEVKASIQSNLEPLTDNCWAITLQTDTLLGSPKNLDETSGKAELEAMYQDTWHDISNQKLTLLRYFARQHLTGGRFRQNTMQKEQAYRPWLLTEAGSVFVLQAEKDVDVKDMLKLWQSQGLPLSKETIEWYRLGDDKQQYWKHTPFVPENGYGEIAINLQHELITPLKPTDQNVTAITPFDNLENGEV